MATELNSLGALAATFAKNLLITGIAMEAGMGKAVELVQKDAKARIGHYQDDVGPFQSWEDLADATEDEKARLGYEQEAPLLRDGTLRDSIVTEHSMFEGVIGSKEPVAAYQEFGTDTIPPRPFLGPAAFANKKKIQRLLGAYLASGLIGSTTVHPSLGYNINEEK